MQTRAAARLAHRFEAGLRLVDEDCRVYQYRREAVVRLAIQVPSEFRWFEPQLGYNLVSAKGAESIMDYDVHFTDH
jgi:hypothetical protein